MEASHHSITLKRELATVLASEIDRRNLTQIEASEAIGISQPRISRLVNGNVSSFSLDYIVNAITKLGLNVSLEIS